MQNGKSWVALFNSFGSRDIYDSFGLPDIGKPNGQRPSKTEYIVKRLTEANGTYNMKDIIVKMREGVPKIEVNPKVYCPNFRVHFNF